MYVRSTIHRWKQYELQKLIHFDFIWALKKSASNDEYLLQRMRIKADVLQQQTATEGLLVWRSV